MRKDLEVRLPIVYNGRSVEEWYTLYTQLALSTARDKTIRAELVEWLRKNAMFTCSRCVKHNDTTCRHAADLRIYDGERICQFCHMMLVWPEDGVNPTAWTSLPVFDPFAGLL